MPRTIIITKKDGTEEAFDPNKLEFSLKRSGAKEEIVAEILEHIDREIYDGVTTDWIYKHAFELLEKKADHATRFRYSLRRAVADLGPSGFPFERFVSEVFKAHGYTTRVGQKIKGKCVTHEIDVIAENTEEIVTAELKFHNKLFIKTDLKVALYVDARFKDIANSGFYKDKKARPYLITNTKFSSNAIKYSECAGLEVMGWDYPRRSSGNLHDFIQESQIHPITALTAFSKKDQRNLLDAGFVTCRDIKKNDSKDIRDSGIVSRERIAKALEEIDNICIK